MKDVTISLPAMKVIDVIRGIAGVDADTDHYHTENEWTYRIKIHGCDYILRSGDIYITIDRYYTSDDYREHTDIKVFWNAEKPKFDYGSILLFGEMDRVIEDIDDLTQMLKDLNKVMGKTSKKLSYLLKDPEDKLSVKFNFVIKEPRAKIGDRMVKLH